MGDFCRFFHIRTTPSKTALSLAPHQPFHNRTIPLAFRRGGARSSCCIDPLHFYNLCKRTLITCLARPSRCTEYCHPHNHCKRTIIPCPRTTLASTRKRVRFCCSVKPSQLWWGLLPICTINEIFRTIPPTFRRGVGLPLPLHLILLFPQPLQNRTIPQKALYPCLPCQR